MKRVFLGGTCNESEWRDELITMLKIDYFNPVVDDWTDEHQAEEIRQRRECDFLLYVITPRMTGVYSIAELVYDSCKYPEKTLFCIVQQDLGVVGFKEGQLRSLMMVEKMVEGCGAKVFETLQDVADCLNKFYIEVPYNPNLIECLIERDGPTEISLKSGTYLFEKNELNDYVCEVLHEDVRRHLLKLPDFRIYQEWLAPAKEFSDKEMRFKQTWERLSDDSYLAYVNGHIAEFNSSSAKLRSVAIEKWKVLLPHMGCPISEVAQLEQKEFNEAAINEPTAFDKAFLLEWQSLNGVRFEKYVAENEQKFLDSPEDIYILAIKKWDKIVKPKTGKGWPFDEE